MPRTPSYSSRYRGYVIDALRTLIADRDGGANYISRAIEEKSAKQGIETLKALAAAGLVFHEGIYEAIGYYPTITGLDFVERYEHPRRLWFRDNALSLFLAALAMAVSTVNVIIAWRLSG